MSAALQQEVIVEVYDRPAGSTPAPIRLGWLRAIAGLSYRRALDGNESLSARIPAVEFPDWIRQTHVLRVVVNGDVTVSGAFEEYRIERIVRSGPTIALEARGLLDDLTLCGPFYMTDTNGRTYRGSVTKTVAEWLAALRTFVQERGFTYWDVAAGAPTDSVTLELSLTTPKEIINRLSNGSTGIGTWEYRFEYDPAAGKYKLYFVEEFNSSADLLRVIGGQNLISIEDEARSEDFISSVAPLGGLDDVEAATSIAGSLWKVSSVATSPDRIVLADPQGRANVKAIVFDDQFNIAAFPVVAQCLRTGRRYDVTDTVASSQTLYLDTADQLVAGDFVELLYVPAGTPLVRQMYRLSAPPGIGRRVCLMKVGTITGAELRFQALHPGTGIASSMLYGRNTGLTGMAMVRSTTVATTTATAFDIGTSRLTVASTAGVAVGDWGHVLSGSNPYYAAFVVTDVVSGTVLEIAQRYRFMETIAFTIPASMASFGVLILREQSERYYVAKHTGDTNYGSDPIHNVWLDHVTNLAAGNYVEAFIETGGIPVDELISPTAVANYPNVTTAPERRSRPVVFSTLGGNPQAYPQLEPFFDSMTDGWGGNMFTGGSVVTSTFTTGNGPNMFQHTSGAVALDNGRNSTTDDLKYVRFGRIFRDPFAGNGRLVIQALVKLYSPAAAWAFQIGLYCPYDLVGTWAAYTAYSDTSGGTAIDPDTFVATLVVDPLANGPLSYYSIGSLLTCGFLIGFYSNGVSYRIDAFRAYWAPDGQPITSDLFSERGAGPELWSRGNEYLSLHHEPSRSLKCDIVDLWRLDRQRYSGQRVLLGAPVSVYNEQTLTDMSARISAVDTTFTPKASARLQIDVKTRQETLSQKLAN